jgi:hypothetical protein
MMEMNVESIFKAIMMLPSIEREQIVCRVQTASDADNEIVGYTGDMKPLTRAEYIARIEEAMESVRRGECITDEELQKEMATW